MTLAKRAFCAASLLALPLAAEAVTVNPYEMAFFSFDTSGLGALEISGSAFSCIFGGRCFEDDGMLAPDATLRIKYGTTQGDADLGTRTFTNTFPTPINNAAGNVASSPSIYVPAEADTVYATFEHVDDNYAVTDFRIFTNAGHLTGSAVAGPVTTQLPLSASGWMLLLGLGVFGFLGGTAWRRGTKRD